MASTSQARKEYLAEYVKKNQRQFMLKVNRIHEPEMVEWLESKDSIQAYLKELIRKDMKANSAHDAE